MTNATAQTYTDHVQILFGAGTCAGMTDGQLLERFVAGRDEAGELAFEALAARHGPMVMRVCRSLLDDPHDVHDAFQAVFLVLARRATAIRQRDSVASWLYGVAIRVTARARITVIRRNVRERRTLGAARASAMIGSGAPDLPAIERNDRAEVVHQELWKLPEKYRAAVVLCYLEGLTHDEAAARLNWPVGTVRSRLARARDRLRRRLSGRGVMAPASLEPLANWMSSEPLAVSGPLATVSGTSSGAISRELLMSLARAASRQAVGAGAAAALVPSASLLLAQGVLNAMIIKKLSLVACAALPVATIALVGGVFVANQSQAQNQGAPAVRPSPNARPAPPKPPEVDPLIKESLEQARARFEAQRAFYEEGRITLDRFIDACYQFELAGLRAAQTEEERTVIKERYMVMLREIEQREKGELAVGRGTSADLTEATQRRLQAEAEQKTNTDLPSILRRLAELERKVEVLQKQRPGN